MPVLSHALPIQPGRTPGNHTADCGGQLAGPADPDPSDLVRILRTLAILTGFPGETLDTARGRGSPGPTGPGAGRRVRATVDGVFCLAAVIPSPPVLVPALCGGASAAGAGSVSGPGAAQTPESAVIELRGAVLAAGAALAEATPHWTVLGTGPSERSYAADTVGTFRGFGVDVRVNLGGPGAESAADPDPELPLAVLVAGWLRAAVAPHVSAQARVLAADTSVRKCAEIGAKLRAELDAAHEPQGVLVVADGAATLSTAAPGYFDERSVRVQTELDRAVATGDTRALLALDPALCAEMMISGRAAYQTLAGLFAADSAPPVATERYRGAPFGVGWFAGLWRPAAVVR